MGDFDKHQKDDKAAEKKKLVVVVMLGGVLLSIGAFHMLKGSPQAASAAIVPSADGSAIAAITAQETPAQATAALQVDPTANLLRGTQNADSLLDAIPRNPFKITPTWESSLVKAVEPAVPGQPQVVHKAQATGAPKLVDTSTLKLTGIFREGQKLFAIINGDIYTVGMTIDDARILDITSNKVTLQRVDALSGPKAYLSIEAKLK